MDDVDDPPFLKNEEDPVGEDIGCKFTRLTDRELLLEEKLGARLALRDRCCCCCCCFCCCCVGEGSTFSSATLGFQGGRDEPLDDNGDARTV